jgi:hypothetical protein
MNRMTLQEKRLRSGYQRRKRNKFKRSGSKGEDKSPVVLGPVVLGPVVLPIPIALSFVATENTRL